jgi:hypothetical protein
MEIHDRPVTVIIDDLERIEGHPSLAPPAIGHDLVSGLVECRQAIKCEGGRHLDMVPQLECEKGWHRVRSEKIAWRIRMIPALRITGQVWLKDPRRQTYHYRLLLLKA